MKLISTLMVCATVFLFTGCKKAVPDEASASLKEVSLSLGAEEWFNKASVSTGKSVLFADGIPQWEDQRFIPSTRSVVVPVKLAGKYFNNKHLVDKYLILQKNSEGKITDGHYLYVLGKHKPSLDKHVLQGDLPAFFHGAVVRTYFEGQQVASRNYKNGAETGKGTKLTRKEHKDNGSEPQNIIPLSEGCAYVTVDWYWQTFENGVLINEEFLFSSQEIICEGGTGGGGNSPGAEAYDAVEAFINEGHSTSILVSRDLEEDADGLKIVDRPNWKIYQAGTWGVFSYETITWERASKNLAFSYSSALSRGYAALGISVGGSRDFTIISKDFTPNSYLTRVDVDIDLTVTHTPNAIVGTLVNPVALGNHSNKHFFPPIRVVVTED